MATATSTAPTTMTTTSGDVFRALVSKFAGRCGRCNMMLPSGTRVWWSSGIGVRCYREDKAACETRRAAWLAAKSAPAPVRPTAAVTAAPARRSVAADIADCRFYTRDQGCPLHGELCA